MKSTKKDTLRLFYNYPAADDDGREWSHVNCRHTGWERDALGIANAYFGARIFGICDRERIQLSENTLSTYGTTRNSGNTNFSETYIHFGHNPDEITDYERDLSLSEATSHVKYTYRGARYEREYFASYPDKVLVIRLTSSGEGNITFTLEPKIPYFSFEGRTGDVTADEVKAEGDTSVCTLTLSGVLPGSNKTLTEAGYDPGSPESTVGYNMSFEAQYRVFAEGGKMTAERHPEGGRIDGVDEYSNATVTVTGADSAYIIISLGTNYELSPRIFTEPDNSKKLSHCTHPHKKITAVVEAASKKSPDTLRRGHLNDYKSLFDRVEVSLCRDTPDVPTDKLVEAYKRGERSTHFDELLFAFGRYMLICSSRKGCMPPNLNAIWNRYHLAICLNGYWSNVNIQMNYWSAFNTNLAECFDSYVDFFRAYIKGNSLMAEKILIEKGKADGIKFHEDELWSVETGLTPFVADACFGKRDGYGNTPYMAESFFDLYDYTRDGKILREVSFPALIRSANFLTRIMTYDEKADLYLTEDTGSPEQSTTAPYKEYLASHEGYAPRGTTYDQSLAYSNYRHVLDSLEIMEDYQLSDWELGAVERIREQIDKLDPVPIGASGQVKEFREESCYGEIGEPNHRHMSHLAAMYPASVINESETPRWLDAARVSVVGRGPKQIWGWSYILHILKWARFGEGNTALDMIGVLAERIIAPNLCSLAGGVFQAEGNLGAPAAIAEMLLQSHEGYIYPLAALPDAWRCGSYKGLCARGAFEVSCEWEDGRATEISVLSKVGGPLKLRYPAISLAGIVDSRGMTITPTVIDADTVLFDTGAGLCYVITEIPKTHAICAPRDLRVTTEGDKHILTFSGTHGKEYRIYRAKGGAPRYELVARTESNRIELSAQVDSGDILTYAVAAVNERGTETRRATCTITIP